MKAVICFIEKEGKFCFAAVVRAVSTELGTLISALMIKKMSKWPTAMRLERLLIIAGGIATPSSLGAC